LLGRLFCGEPVPTSPENALVEVMHTTVLGIGERSGNAPMEEIVMALKTMYGVDVGIDCTKLTPLANLVQRLTGVLVPTSATPPRSAGRARCRRRRSSPRCRSA
jgi:hypothetical protein